MAARYSSPAARRSASSPAGAADGSGASSSRKSVRATSSRASPPGQVGPVQRQQSLALADGVVRVQIPVAEGLPRGKRPGARERLPAQPLLQGRAGDLFGQARTRIGQAVLRPGARGEDAALQVRKVPRRPARVPAAQHPLEQALAAHAVKDDSLAAQGAHPPMAARRGQAVRVCAARAPQLRLDRLRRNAGVEELAHPLPRQGKDLRRAARADARPEAHASPCAARSAGRMAPGSPW